MGYEDGIFEQMHKMEAPAICGAAISPYRILQAGTDPREVIVATAGTQYPLGVAGDASENGASTYAEDDEMVFVVYGITYLEMSGTGTRHQRIMATAGGLGLGHTNTDGVYILGNAAQAWTAGQIIPIIIDRYFIGDWSLS